MIEKTYPLGQTGKTIRYIAEGVRKERTGTHAKIIIGVDSTILDYDNFNVERGPDRTRLANSAHKLLGEIDRAEWTAVDMKHALDVFCMTLWQAHVAQSVEVEDVTGEGVPEQEYAIDPYCPLSAGSILFGPRGLGKSATLLTMAVQVDSGAPGIFTVPYQRPVLYINLERSRDSLRRRLARINLALGLPAERPLRMINARGRSLTDIADRALKTVTDGGAEVVFVDSLSRAGIELTKDDQANAAIDVLNRFGTWAAVAHEPKNRTARDASVFGSSMFENAADMVIRLSSQVRDVEHGIALRVTKASDMRTPAPFCFAAAFDDGGITSLRRASLSEFSELAGGRSGGSIADDLVAYLLDVERATLSEAAEELDVGRTYLQRIVHNERRIVKLGKEGRKQFYGVRELRIVGQD